MHEASAAEALVKMISETLAARSATAAPAAGSSGAGVPATGAPARVSLVRLVVGESKGYMEESLSFYFRAFAAGTPLEGAALDVRFVKASFRCGSCGGVFERKRFSFECPTCGGPGILESEGPGLYVDSIEVEESE
jgi:hydrogenase nickel incorporation protein HypA/HybF